MSLKDLVNRYLQRMSVKHVFHMYVHTHFDCFPPYDFCHTTAIYLMSPWFISFKISVALLICHNAFWIFAALMNCGLGCMLGGVTEVWS